MNIEDQEFVEIKASFELITNFAYLNSKQLFVLAYLGSVRVLRNVRSVHEPHCKSK